MKTSRIACLTLSLFILLAAATVDARTPAPKNYDGRWARSRVVSYNKTRGLSTDVRVSLVRRSTTGKSSQVAVETKGSGKVRLYNIAHSSGKVSATRTGLTSQKTARGIANLKLRRENRPLKGTFSGVNSSGLSTTGKTYRINSNTDRNEAAYVKLVGGRAYHVDRK